jgi:hypothetical protein
LRAKVVLIIQARLIEPEMPLDSMSHTREKDPEVPGAWCVRIPKEPGNVSAPSWIIEVSQHSEPSWLYACSTFRRGVVMGEAKLLKCGAPGKT